MLLAILFVGGILAMSPISDTTENQQSAQKMMTGHALAASSTNVSIPYVDNHYGSADGIIDPTEYALNYTDPVSGVISYFEHNGTFLYVGLEAKTTGWIGLAWQNYSSTFDQAGLNNSDVVVGYTPGTTLTDMWRVVGTDIVTVHYVLSLRNGTIIQEDDYPDDTSTEQVNQLAVLKMYNASIIGMRIGEVRHFVIPAAQGYTDTSNALYGQDLIYTITLTRITRNSVTRTTNPASTSRIVYSDEHGTSTFQHLPDSNQGQIVAADGSDNGTITQLEYVIKLNSTDINDVPLLSNNSIAYPFVFMYGLTEELNALPVAHTPWTEPVMFTVQPNAPPTMIVISPEDGAVINWVASIKLNATNDFVVNAFYRVDNKTWTALTYNFNTLLWEKTVDFSIYDVGPHVLTLNATDPSNATGIVTLNFEIDRPYFALIGMRISVSRSLVVTPNYGSRAEDTYAITNNGSVPINAIDLYLPEKYEGNLLDFVAAYSTGDEIRVVRLSNADGMIRWRLHLSSPVDLQQSATIKTTTYFHTLFYLTIAQDFEYQLDFLRYPLVPYVLTRAAFALSFEGGGSLVPNEKVPDQTDYNLAPLTQNIFSVKLRLYTDNTISSRVTRIIVDAWGWLSYEETVTLQNTGGSAIMTLDFTLPAYSTNIRVFDEVGDLAFTQVQSSISAGDYNATRDVQIKLATDRFGTDKFKPGFKYTFQVTYIVQASEYQSSASNGVRIDFPMALLGDVLVTSHTIDVVFPVSVSAAETTQGFMKYYGVFDTTYRYVFHNQTQRNPAELSVVYQATLGAAARPILFSLVVGIIAAIYVSYRKVELPEEIIGTRIDTEEYDDASKIKQVGAPPELLSDFANLYSRKTSLNIDLEKLDSSRRKGKVKKREYMMRESDIKKQIEEIDTKLPPVKEDLGRYGPRYRDLIAQLELQDERINGAKAGLRQLLLRKKKQRISRAAFEKSRQEYLKTIQKATSATDRILLTIQEEAGDV
jgi:hypothetical protein